MTVIEIIEQSLKFNELLVKFLKGEKWFEIASISIETKNEQFPRFETLMKEIESIFLKFEKAGIEFSGNIITNGIELPESLKRQEVEGVIEKFKELECAKYGNKNVIQ